MRSRCRGHLDVCRLAWQKHLPLDTRRFLGHAGLHREMRGHLRIWGRSGDLTRRLWHGYHARLWWALRMHLHNWWLGPPRVRACRHSLMEWLTRRAHLRRSSHTGAGHLRYRCSLRREMRRRLKRRRRLGHHNGVTWQNLWRPALCRHWLISH